MKLIVGLGNYGDEYIGTRHNAGFMAVNALVEKALHGHTKSSRWKLNSKKSLLYFWLNDEVEVIKPQTYMNKSGQAINHVMSAHQEIKPNDVLVVHDDWSFSLGIFKLQVGKGANYHNGVQSAIDTIGTRDFWRLRIGIGGGDANLRESSATDYVLGMFRPEEKETITTHIVSEVIPTIESWINGEQSV